MTTCDVQQDGAVELFFYDELDPAARERMLVHLRTCRECASAFEELQLIRDLLAERPDVSAPPAGDWSGFMRRLNTAVNAPARGTSATIRSYIGLLATAALLAIVTISVYFVAKDRSSFAGATGSLAVSTRTDDTLVETAGLKSVGEQHFERSKLVVLGLAAKEADQTPVADWAYERELASSLLKDTRVYRMAAEQRGLNRLAGVMRDLELVLLETSMADERDGAALGQIQKLIQKRGLIEKMDTVATLGM
jgi:hypothetical protein